MKRVVLFGTLFIISSFFSGFVYGFIPASERAALIALYNSTNGDNWTNNSGWKTPPLDADGFAMTCPGTGTPASWYGIMVSDNHVKSIYLQSNQLSGSIPSQLGSLTNLQYLDLKSNQLSGSIPSELGNLSNLKELYLNFNQLSGSIPSELGNLSNLQELYLNSNQLSGSIPSELGNLSNLQDLNLSYNQLSGSIPSELGNLLNLISLGLDHNQLSGNIPSELGNLSVLHSLNLSENRLNGSIPFQFGNLTNLRILYLNSNQLSGSIPSQFGNLTNLEYLLLLHNQLSGTIPSQLGNLTNLKHLNLFCNQLSGDIPPELGNLSNLTRLSLGRNRLSGSIPSELGNLSNLTRLCLRSNKLGGSIPTSLTNLVNLSSSWETDIGFNALYTSNSALISFLNSIDSDWADTQTIAPTDVSAAALSTSSINVTWTPIVYTGYTGETGGYMVYYSTTSGGPWTYSGITANKSAKSYTVSGLNTGTTYYFVVKTKSNPSYSNANTVESEYSSEASATTQNIPGTFTLNVQSLPDTGAAITISPNDNNGYGNGITNFTRTYNDGTSVSLTAFSTCNGGNFSKWTIDGVSNTSAAIQVIMDSNHTVIAFYESGSIQTYTLSVQSSPDTGATITVSPNDNNTNGDGITNFTRIYNNGTSVTLTAPSSYNGKDFSKWTVNSSENTSQTIQFTMNSNLTAIAYYATLTTPEISLNRSKLNYGGEMNGSKTGSQSIIVSNAGGGTLNWTAAADVSWLNLNSSSGIGFGEISVSVDVNGLSIGTYTGKITVSDPNASNSPQTVSVLLKVYGSGQTAAPFGQFATPIDGAIVSSSIPVTGWALDDIGVESVKIYLGEVGNLIYIGDAVFVEGARPDIEQAYPDYPMNYKAGWGYMMLTNFLPNGGNGTFKIHAIATDVEGHQVTLGTKTIIVDNANAVKPFGAIDTPTQGGTANGISFRNHGWVLTPLPNSIPTDGSTINVYVDGMGLGNPNYNIYRSDIAALFPEYANKDGAGGYFDIDTTAYTNGVHTIYWTAQDNAGNTDGIGSRYFSIQNTGVSRAKSANNQMIRFDLPQISELPVDFSNPIRVKQGYGKHIEPRIITPNDKGIARIKIKELEKIEIQLADMELEYEATGYVIAGENLRPLPIGSSIKNGVFYWRPMPGFLGDYKLVFVVEGPDGDLIKREVMVSILPKFGLKK